jgi:4-amino-4-deoxy-L-arabinose transferase-like glycosyltransferase
LVDHPYKIIYQEFPRHAEKQKISRFVARQKTKVGWQLFLIGAAIFLVFVLLPAIALGHLLKLQQKRKVNAGWFFLICLPVIGPLLSIILNQK